MSFMDEFRQYGTQTEEELNRCFDTYLEYEQKTLLESMRYSLMAGGKRIRPILVKQFYQAAGGEAGGDIAPISCAVEMLHTYSLIHDDLPCMDNDDLRRGRPTNHKVYGECTAVLAGDALQCAAFQSILSAKLPAEYRAAAALELADCAGAYGMCGGQQLDMEGETRVLTLEEIQLKDRLKTGCLIQAACVMGVLAAGKTRDSVEAKAAADYADKIGRAFQIRDDILNVTSDAETMGKPVGNDEESCKSTYVSLLGLERCQELVKQLSEDAKKSIHGIFEQTEFLEELAEYLAGRKN